MTLCPNGHANPDGRTYCIVPECHLYIDSSEEVQTSLSQIVTPAEPPMVMLDSPRVNVSPGQSEVRTEVRISNPDTTADEFRLEVTGQPAAWATIEPSTLTIEPGAEAPARIVFRPPSPARPGTVEFGVKARAVSSGLSAVLTGTLEIIGYGRLSARLDPQTARGRASTQHTLTLTNEGTVAVSASLQALAPGPSGPSGALSVEVSPTTAQVPPGATATIRVVARAERRGLLGGDVSHSFRVVVSGGPEPVAVDGTMVQKSTRALLLPLVLIPLLLVAGGIGYALLNQGSGNDGSGPPPTPPLRTYSEEVLGDAPLRYFRLDETAGRTAKDSSTYNVNGTYHPGPPVSQAGAVANDASAHFNGVDTYVDIGPGVNLPHDFTLEAWVELGPGIGNSDAIVGQKGPGQDANFFQQKFRLFKGRVTTRTEKFDYAVATEDIQPNRFTHIVVTRSGNTFTLFIDGALNVSDTQNATVGIDSFGVFMPKAIGRGNAGFFAGQIDEVAIYDHALSPERVLAHFNARGRG